MDDKTLSRIREILGDEFTPQEIQEFLQANPSLASELETFGTLWSDLKRRSTGELSPSFSQKIMAELRSSRRSEVWWKGIFTLPRLALTGGLTAALLVGLWWKRPWESSLQPGITIEQAQGNPAEKIYRVHFAYKDPDAHRVSVARDFNDWNPQDLKTERGGVFAAEIDLKEGSYAYSFFVDGKRWVIDPSADKIVDDGFGNKNSIINL